MACLKCLKVAAFTNSEIWRSPVSAPNVGPLWDKDADTHMIVDAVWNTRPVVFRFSSTLSFVNGSTIIQVPSDLSVCSTWEAAALGSLILCTRSKNATKSYPSPSLPGKLVEDVTWIVILSSLKPFSFALLRTASTDGLW